PSAADLALSRLELRLHQEDEIGVGFDQPGESRCDRAERYERQIGHYEREPPARVFGSDIAEIGAFHHHDAIIVPESLIELTVADVEGDDFGRTPLEQNLGEAAGGGAGVERTTAPHLDAEIVQRSFQLDG